MNLTTVEDIETEARALADGSTEDQATFFNAFAAETGRLPVFTAAERLKDIIRMLSTEAMALFRVLSP